MTRIKVGGLAILWMTALAISPGCGSDRQFSPASQGAAGLAGAASGAGSGAGSGNVGTTGGSAGAENAAGSGSVIGNAGASGEPATSEDTCSRDEKECDGACVAVDDPRYGCGPTQCSPSACPTAEGATFACRSGACVIESCSDGMKSCGGACVAQSDPTYGCGESTCDASSCPNPGEGGSVECRDGACVIKSCPPSFKKCADKCVSVADPTYGCGDTTCDSTSCPEPGSGTLTCKAGACVIGTCGANTKSCNSKCVPTDANNGCAAESRCTACASNEACAGTPTTCQCVPNVKATACAGKCDSVPNGCGGSHACGTCSSPKTCGGGGTANVCGCTALSKATACGSMACGSASDGCGGNYNCGTCGEGLMCSSGACKECSKLSDCGADYFSCINGTCACAQQTSVNLLVNGGFDRSLTGWTVTSAKWNATDSDDCPRSGAVSMAAGRISQCVRGATGGVFYALGLRYISDSTASMGCFGSFHSDANCVTAVGPDFLNLSAGGTGSGNWEPTSVSVPAPATTKSILIDCFFDGSGDGYLDQMYLSVGKAGSAGAHF